MSFDPLVANAGRLRILTSLAVDERQEFVHLRRSTQLTDGNLASHARRLQSGGLIAIDKEFRDGKPVTHFTLTVDGRKALEAHTRRLIAAISHRRLVPARSEVPQESIANPPVRSTTADAKVSQAAPLPMVHVVDDDWID